MSFTRIKRDVWFTEQTAVISLVNVHGLVLCMSRGNAAECGCRMRGRLSFSKLHGKLILLQFDSYLNNGFKEPI